MIVRHRSEEDERGSSKKAIDPIEYYTGLSVSLGTAFGLALGAAFNDAGMGLALGLAFGVAIGVGIGTGMKKKRDAESSTE